MTTKNPRGPGAPILFLDIDGVMNTTDSILRYKSNRVFTPESVQCLKKVIAKTACNIVISSTWREPKQWKILPEVFTENGLASALDRIIDRTPILPPDDHPTREDEIDYWLESNKFAGLYAVLDDIPFESEHADRLVRTSTDTGFTKAECIQVLELLLGR